MDEMTIKFNNENYIAKYNKQTGYYEIDLQAPTKGGIYKADITYVDLLEKSYEDTQVVQVLLKEKIKIETNKVFMWIFNNKDLSVRDIIEISDYEINIDEETNANSIIKVLKKTKAKENDIIAIKKNNEVVYWGVIDKIQNEDGKILYEYTVRYITNIFDQEIALNKNVESDKIEDGYYTFKFAKDVKKTIDVSNGSVDNGANIWLYERNNTNAQIWKVETNSNGSKKIKNIGSGKVFDVSGGTFENNTNLQQWADNPNADAQQWDFIQEEPAIFKIKSKNHNFFVTVEGGGVNNGTNLKIYEDLNTRREGEKQKFIIEKLNEMIIREVGIEDFIALAIKENFISNKDTFVNREYLEVRVKSHTKLQTSVSNVTDNVYNLHTFMTNCTQLYNINFNVFLENKKLIIEIENKRLKKELIDVTAHPVSNYVEVFETDIISKVEVLTDTIVYYLYLLNNRTTTENETDENRAEGKAKTVYTANIEDAKQKALDTIQANKYNHMINLSILDKIIKIGTPVALKTKTNTIFDTYVSAIKITPKKFIDITFGNIRVKFLDKLKQKERKK